MEAVGMALLPLALLLLGLGLVVGRFPTPQGVSRSVLRTSWVTLRWLWRDRSRKGGGARQRQPRMRYRR